MRQSSNALLVSSIALAAALCVGPALAGTVSVSSADPMGFSDAGSTPWEKQANLDALTRHLQSLGQRHLPGDSSLKVELLDIDLAGTTRFSARAGQELRVVKGGADVPRISLRYVFESAGKAPLSAQESVTDLDYLRRMQGNQQLDRLHYEKQMLERWFMARFVAPR